MSVDHGGPGPGCLIGSGPHQQVIRSGVPDLYGGGECRHGIISWKIRPGEVGLGQESRSRSASLVQLSICQERAMAGLDSVCISLLHGIKRVSPAPQLTARGDGVFRRSPPEEASTRRIEVPGGEPIWIGAVFQ